MNLNDYSELVESNRLGKPLDKFEEQFGTNLVQNIVLGETKLQGHLKTVTALDFEVAVADSFIAVASAQKSSRAIARLAPLVLVVGITLLITGGFVVFPMLAGASKELLRSDSAPLIGATSVLLFGLMVYLLGNGTLKLR